jgi:single-stranded DNA-binding protein
MSRLPATACPAGPSVGGGPSTRPATAGGCRAAPRHAVTVWGSPAEAAAKHLAKGRQVLVEGALRTRSWDDQESGQRRHRTDVLAARVEYLGSASRNGGAAVTPAEPAAIGGDVDPDDVPF